MESTTKTKLSEIQIKGIIASHFPKEQIHSIEELTDGMQNAAWLISGTGRLRDKVVLKIGAAPDTDLLTYEQDNLVAEKHAYDRLKEKNIPIPKILVYDNKKELISSSYLIMTYIQGKKWRSCLQEISSDCRAGLLYELGKYTATIHSVTGEKFGYIKNNDRLLYNSWGEVFGNMIHAILDDGRKRNFQLPYSRIERLVQQCQSLLYQITTPRLVDFDLWAGNILLDSKTQNRIVGIIDFGNCFYGDPYAEFVSAVHCYKDVRQEKEFQKGYETVTRQPFVVTEEDGVRMELYRLYLDLIVYVESYRYDEKYGQAVRKTMIKTIEDRIDKLETNSLVNNKIG